MRLFRTTDLVMPRLTGVAVMTAATLVIAPSAHAQTAYDVTLRSIAPATITAASFDGRARQATLSIAPSSLENQPSIVPAIYDPSLGRFVSALVSARGAISVTSSGAVSVVVSNQSTTMQLGGGPSGVPLRSETVASPATTLTTQQITTTATAANAR